MFIVPIWQFAKNNFSIRFTTLLVVFDNVTGTFKVCGVILLSSSTSQRADSKSTSTSSKLGSNGMIWSVMFSFGMTAICVWSGIWSLVEGPLGSARTSFGAVIAFFSSFFCMESVIVLPIKSFFFVSFLIHSQALHALVTGHRHYVSIWILCVGQYCYASYPNWVIGVYLW